MHFFKYIIFILLTLFSITSIEASESWKLTGKIVDDADSSPLPYANVKIDELSLWTETDDAGDFVFTNIPSGRVVIEISLMGYADFNETIDIDKDTNIGVIRIREKNLALPDIEVTAKRKSQAGTTSYTIDRSVLDHAQVVNLTDIMSLLPGGQTVNSSLMNDNRIALRAGEGEGGNASFGTAVEIDGVRLDNNANMDETLAASTRNVSSANIGSLEVVPGIPGVEYGDVSNGIVKVNPRRGRSPWIVEASINPYTRQFALLKGLSLPGNSGILNFSVEHARSFSNIASPYTSYNRNILNLGYLYTFLIGESTLRLNIGLSGNIGGYRSDADPDAFKDTYQKVRDNKFDGNVKLDWINNTRRGIFRVYLQGAVSYSDRITETNTNNSSSSTQAYIHVTEEGYNIAQDYTGGDATGSIVLGPIGYWYVKSFNDQKPFSLQFKVKGSWTNDFAGAVNMITAGVDFQSSSNFGHGLYYEDYGVAPTWRPYDYRDLPALNTFAVFIEDKLTWKRLTLTAGLRNDNTYIKKSGYDNLSTLSPRLNAQVNLYKSETVQLNLFGGYGRGYKLPSFQVLYPADSYSDRLTFTPGSTSENKAYYAYYTHVSKTFSNPDLRWQSTDQADFGLNGAVKGISFSLSGFYNHTLNPYQGVNIYTPFSYTYTSQTSLENCGIPSSDRHYDVDPVTGIVSVTSISNGNTITLPYSERRTYINNKKFVNGSPLTRYGLEWIVEIPLSGEKHPVISSLRFDGSYYHYKGVSNMLIAGSPAGVGDYAAESGISPLIGYYSGSNVSSTTSTSGPTVSNGFVSSGCSLNTMFTVRVPKLRMILTLRLESTFLNYKRQLADTKNAILLQTAGDIAGNPYAGEKDAYVALYPEFYSTWENPAEKIPFADALAKAAQNDPQLYQQLCNLIIKSNTSYYFNPQSVSPYFSANFSITKEIGKWVSISFYANNFFNNMSFVRNTQTGLESSLFSSGYIPKFYYGVSLRIKL